MKRVWSRIGGLIATLMILSSGLYASPTISLLTCGPSDEYVFYLYGHSALRVQEDGRDVVYNYGYFSLDQDNFVLNFMMGKPLYSLGVVSFEDFLYEYGAQGRSVTEQVLNLTPQEAERLKEKLEWNAQPENREYLYNFYFDNCATRPRNFIEEFSGGLEYRIDPSTIPTFREAIRHMSYSAQWYTMGADLCLGWKSDKQMTAHDAAFLPELLQQELDIAVRKDNGQPIVTAKMEHLPQVRIVTEVPNTVRWPFWTPIIVGLVYFILFYLSDHRWSRLSLQVLRSIFYLLLAVGGVILYFLGIISSHPHTFPNANMLLMHPLYFVLLVWIWQKNKSGRPLFWLYFINFVSVVCYLGMGYKQALPEGMVIWALILMADCFIEARRHWFEFHPSATDNATIKKK